MAKEETLGELIQRLLVELIAEGVALGMVKYEDAKLGEPEDETYGDDED